MIIKKFSIFSIFVSAYLFCIADVIAAVDIKSIAAQYGLLPPSQTASGITLKSKYSTIAFSLNSRKIFYNKLLIWMNGPVEKKGRSWTISNSDFEKIIDPLLRPDNALRGEGFKTIVLDPGHGGYDTGAIGNRKVYEKKVVLDIAKRVSRKLQAFGKTVKLTRTRDSFISLQERVARAKKWRADIFVSIHVNAAHNSRACGLETYIISSPGFSSTSPGRAVPNTYPGNRRDKANILLAYYIHKETLGRLKIKDRGIRHSRFDVIKNAPCPAILIECGFVSNKIEEEKMLKRAYRDSAAEGIAQGILTYISKIK